MAIAVRELMAGGRRSDEWQQRGLALRAFRQRLSVKATDVARKLGKADSSYRALEKGYVNITDEVVERLADALDVAPGALHEALGRPPNEDTPPSTLAARVLASLSPRRAHLAAEITSQLEDLSEHDQDVILESVRAQAAGLKVLRGRE